MRRRRFKQDDTETALANFALTFAKALLVFCVVLFLMIAPPKKEEDGIKPKMEYLISISWPIDVDADVDVWMRDPDGNILWYGNKEIGLANLERDDMGKRNNKIMIGDREVVKLNNEELVSFRGFKPGEYVINVHLYSYGMNFVPNDPINPLPVRITITRLNPSVSTPYVGNASITFVRQEVHLVRFTLDAEGNISNIETELPVMIRETVKAADAGMFNPMIGPSGATPQGEAP